MKITRVEVIPLVRQLEEAFAGGTYRVVNRNTLVTRIYTEAGIVGQAFGGDEDQTQTEIVTLIRDHFEPLLVGEDARDVERLWDKLFFCHVDLGNRGLACARFAESVHSDAGDCRRRYGPVGRPGQALPGATL